MQCRHRILVGIGLAGLIYAGWYATHRDTSLSRLYEEQTIRVGYAVEPPYASLEADSTVSGLFPELAQRISSELGIQQVIWVQTEFNTLIPGLQSNRFDVIAAGLVITAERTSIVNFSTPVVQVQQAMLMVEGNPNAVTTYHQALTQPQTKIAVIAGSIEEHTLVQLGIPDQQIVRVPDAGTGYSVVRTGLSDTLALTEPTLRWMIASEAPREGQSRLVVVPVVDAPVQSAAFAFRQSDRALQQGWDTAQHVVLQRPTTRDLYHEWAFSYPPPPLLTVTQELVRP